MRDAPGAGRARPLSLVLVIVALLFFALAAFYATQRTSLLASTTDIHWKHAVLSAGLGVLSLIGANVARKR